MPSDSSTAAGRASVGPDFVRLGSPALRFEYAEAWDVLDASDVLDCDPLPLLRMLPCVSVLRCPKEGSCEGDRDAPAMLGRRLSKGPGAMLFKRFVTVSPPFVRGLRGAKRGLGSAYRWLYVASSLSRSCGSGLRGAAARFVGNRGNAESMLENKSGEGGETEGGTGLVVLRLRA